MITWVWLHSMYFEHEFSYRIIFILQTVYHVWLIFTTYKPLQKFVINFEIKINIDQIAVHFSTISNNIT